MGNEEHLQKITLLSFSKVSGELARSYPDAAFDLSFSSEVNFMRDEITLRLRGRVLGHYGAYEVALVGYPGPWWHLYAKYAPGWLKRRIEPRWRCRVLRPLVLYPNLKEGIPALDWQDYGTYTWPQDKDVITAYRSGDPEKITEAELARENEPQ